MKPNVVWTCIIVALLAIPCLFYGAMLILVQIHPVTFVQDYEQKAANWDAIRRQEQQSSELGWKIDLRTEPTNQRYQVQVTLRISDRHGAPIAGAAVDIEAFYMARASKVIRQTLKSTEDDAYQAILPIRQHGMWEFRVTARHQNDLFCQTLQKNVDSPSER